MRLGVNLPTVDIGGDPLGVRDFSQTAEALGYDHLALADHVLGVNAANIPNWGNRNTSADYFHDPFLLFSYLSACTTQIEFSTQVLILPQRQTALVAKQAACLDILSSGRFRFGIGIGWNEAEYIALNESFHNRGRRSVEQINILKELWSKPHVNIDEEWHKITDAGINPLPSKRSIPLWIGGHEDVTLQRVARYGDGWIMLQYPPGQEAQERFDLLRAYTREADRPESEVGIEVWTSAVGTPEHWRKEIEFWKKAGVTHICLNNSFSRYHHQAIEDRSIENHTSAMQLYKESVEDIIS